MENLPKQVANQWRNWGKHPDYILGDATIKHLYYCEIKAAITAFSIEDDEFAPLEATQWMPRQYKNTKTKSIHLAPKDFQVPKIGHFGVFKERFSDTIWPIFLNEITL